MRKKFEKLLIEAHYFPSVQYCSKWLMADEIVIEANENYQKGSYRNRFRIMNSYGEYELSIPLKKGKNERQSIRDVLISYGENWELQQWRAIKTAYGRSPFFEHYEHLIEPLFCKNHRYLFDLNLEILNALKTILDIDVTFSLSSDYLPKGENETYDIRDMIHPKPHRAKEDISFDPRRYEQVFASKHGFLENMSILDLLFCCGPETRRVLNDSIYWNDAD